MQTPDLPAETTTINSFYDQKWMNVGRRTSAAEPRFTFLSITFPMTSDIDGFNRDPGSIYPHSGSLISARERLYMHSGAKKLLYSA